MVYVSEPTVTAIVKRKTYQYQASSGIGGISNICDSEYISWLPFLLYIVAGILALLSLLLLRADTAAFCKMATFFSLKKE